VKNKNKVNNLKNKELKKQNNQNNNSLNLKSKYKHSPNQALSNN